MKRLFLNVFFCTNKTSETNKVRIVNRANVKTNKNANIQRENYPINAIPKITQGLNHNYAQHIISTTNENDINTKKHITAKKPLICEFCMGNIKTQNKRLFAKNVFQLFTQDVFLKSR